MKLRAFDNAKHRTYVDLKVGGLNSFPALLYNFCIQTNLTIFYNNKQNHMIIVINIEFQLYIS